MLELYYTDEKGNRIEEKDLVPDTIVYLNVRGENIKGEKGNLELTSSIVDFEYEGKYLENDILEDYTCENNHNKIKLKVIKPKND